MKYPLWSHCFETQNKWQGENSQVCVYKQHAPEHSMGKRWNKKENQKISVEKWKCKHNISWLVVWSKHSSKKGIYRDKCLI